MPDYFYVQQGSGMERIKDAIAYIKKYPKQFRALRGAEKRAFFYANPDVELNVLLAGLEHKGACGVFEHKPTSKCFVVLSWKEKEKNSEVVAFWLDPELKLSVL